MTFLIADTFTDSLARLTGDEQKAVKTTAFDLQVNPAAPGLNFHKLDKAKDKRFWSVRVSADIRLIVHRTDTSLLLCYVDHHDRAYAWGERRKLETHRTTGAAQIVEIRASVRESVRIQEKRKGVWEVDILFPRPDGKRGRDRKRVPASSRTVAERWAEQRQRELLTHGVPEKPTEVPTLKEFESRFMDG